MMRRPQLRAARSPDATAAAAIEIASLGGSHVLHSPLSGAIVLSDPLGAYVLERLRLGLDPNEIAQDLASDPEMDAVPVETIRDLIAEILAGWTAAGLLDTAAQPFPQQVAFAAAPPGYLRVFALGAQRIALACADAALTAQLATILSRYRVADTPADTPQLTVQSDAQGFGVFLDGTALWGRCTRDEARHFVLREVVEHLCRPAGAAAILHAAGVTRGDSCLLMTGSSGRGKTTLALGLIDRGCAAIGDDHILLAGNGRDAIALPVAAGVKRGSWQLPEVARLAIGATGGGENPRDGVAYLAPLRQAPAGQPCRITGIILPRYEADGPDSMQRIDPVRAFREIVAAGARPCGRRRSILSLVALLGAVPVHELRYSGSRYALEICEELLAS